MKRTARAASVVTLGSLAGATAISWPLLPRAGEILTSGRASSDLGYAIFAQWWMGESLAGNGSFFNCPLVYFPDGQNLAGSVWNVLALALTGPMHWLAEPVAAWNLSLLLLATINSAVAFGLGHRLGGRTGGIASAAVVLCCPWMWMELFEGRIEQGLIAPLILYFWALLNLKERHPRAWIAAGVSMGLVGATYWFMALLSAVATLPVLGRQLLRRAVWLDLLKAAGLSAVVAAPFFALVATQVWSPEFASVATDARRTFDMRVTNSVSPLHALIAHVGPAHQAIPLVALAGVLASLLSRAAWPLLGTLVGALILAAGPVLTVDAVPVFMGDGLIPLPMWAMDAFPGFGRFIWPYRALAIAVVATAGIAAVVFSRLCASRRGQIVGALAIVLLFAEGRGLLLEAVADTDAQLPHSPLDPPRDGAYYAHRVPDWMMRIPADSGAMLTFPLSETNGWAPLFIPFHGHALASGDGSSEFGLQPTRFRERVEQLPLLQAWVQGEAMTPQMTADATQLAQLGFSWVVQFHGTDDPEADQLSRSIRQVLDAPVHTETGLTVWALR